MIKRALQTHDFVDKLIIKYKSRIIFTGVEEEFEMIHDKKLLEKEMKIAVKNLDFERAAELRDLIEKLKKSKS